MKKLSKIVVIVLSILMVVSVVPFALTAATSGKCGDDVSYSYDSSNGTLTISGNGPMCDYESAKDRPWYDRRNGIKEVVVLNGVTRIGSQAFADLEYLSKVTIPESVESIGNWAFSGCKVLTDFSLPKNLVSIGVAAFRECNKLTTVSIPKTVTSIGSEAFNRNPALISIAVDSDNMVYHSSGNCLIKTETKELILGCTNSSIPSDGSVTKISPHAFSYSKIRSVIIPDCVTEIGVYAFYECRDLSSISLGNGVTKIDGYAFGYCYDIYGCIVLPHSLTDLGGGVFTACKNLRMVAVPDSVTAWGYYMFSDCDNVVVHCNAGSFAEECAKKEGIKVTYHNYETSTVEPTCTEDGSITYACHICGDYYSEVIPAAHKWNDPIIITEPTCTEDGSEYRICSVCYEGESIKLPATGHNYEITQKDATHTEDGYIKNVCSKCGDTITTVILAEGHSFTEWNIAVQPECEKEGTRVRQCVECGYSEKESISAKGHSFGKWETLIEATDSKAGLKQRKCANCTEIEQAEIPVIVYPNPFDDVPADTWYTKAALWCNAKGYFTGVGAATFSPNTKLTRAQFVQILAKVSGDDFDNIAYTAKFTDVPDGKWFTKAVMWCVKNGVTGGTSATTFTPNGEVTREQLATFFLAYAKSRGYDVTATADLGKYDDANKISGWAKTAVQWAVGEGLISGTTATTISSKTVATRAQASVIFKNFVEVYVAKQAK